MSTEVVEFISQFSPILMIVLMVVVFYFLLIRPQNKRQKQVDKMLSELKTGDRVKTIGGLYGRITHVREGVITIECGPGKTELVFDRKAIATVEDIPDVENTMK